MAWQAVTLPEIHPLNRRVRYGVKEKLELRAAFQDVVVKIRHDEREAIVVVCSPDGKVAWLEEASWKPFVDLRWYASGAQHSCDAFTLDPSMARGKQKTSPGSVQQQENS